MSGVTLITSDANSSSWVIVKKIVNSFYLGLFSLVIFHIRNTHQAKGFIGILQRSTKLIHLNVNLVFTFSNDLHINHAHVSPICSPI